MNQVGTINTTVNQGIWYSIENLAELCGFDVNYLRNNIKSILYGFNFDIETKKVGKSHQILYSENTLKMLKQYQIKNSVPNALKEKTMTVKELASALGTADSTIRNKVAELFPECIKNGVTTRLTEQQVTILKKNLVPRDLTLKSKVETSVTRLEMMQNIQRDMQWLISFNEELRKENELQKQQISEQKPKVDSYNRISDSTGLKTIQEVADILGYGSKTYFSLLRGEKILFLTNGINLPKREYIDSGYFEVKEVPYERNGQSCLYSKVYVTAKGLLWLEKKTPKRA